MVDQEKIKQHPNNKDFEFSRVVLLQVKATITRRCSEHHIITVDEWAMLYRIDSHAFKIYL